MNGIQNITAKIEADAQLEIGRILDEARKQADEITAGYRAQAEAEGEEIIARGRKAAAERAERQGSVVQLECRKAQLAVKQEVIDSAFQLALNKLLALPEADYVALLAKLAVEAAPNGKGKFIFSQTDRARVGKAVVMAANEKLNGSMTLAEETRLLNGGFILCDGAVEVNCSFDTLVRLQKAGLTGEVTGVLFP